MERSEKVQENIGKYLESVKSIRENNRKVPETSRKVCKISSEIADSHCTLYFPLYYSNIVFFFEIVNQEFSEIVLLLRVT